MTDVTISHLIGTENIYTVSLIKHLKTVAVAGLKIKDSHDETAYVPERSAVVKGCHETVFAHGKSIVRKDSHAEIGTGF